MKLFLNATSPYARMARITMLEAGLEQETELCWVDPWADDQQLLAVNPQAKIPALMTREGVALTESMLIARYFAEQAENEQGSSLQQGEQLAGLSQGLMDASFATVIGKKYLDEAANNSVLSQRRLRAIGNTLDYLEENLQHLSTGHGQLPILTLGDISLAVALDYIDFRLPELLDATKYPYIGEWRLKVIARPSFSSTAF